MSGNGNTTNEAAGAESEALNSNGNSKKSTTTKLHIPFPSCRLVLSVLAFLGFFVVYCLRVNLSVALVAMVNTTYVNELEGEAATNSSTEAEKLDDVCEVESHNETHKTEDSGEYNWDSKKQGIILAAFFYGYITTQIPGGILAQKFGGKVLLLFGIFWTSILTLLTPLLTYIGDFAALVVTRILEGVGEGVTYPAMHFMLSKWAPPLERGRIATFVYAGAQVGTVVTMPVSGLLCQYVSWESVFYVFGALGVAWSVLWFFLIYDTPQAHPRIAAAEREYIESAMGSQNQTKGSLKVPWLEFAKSPPVYAVAVSHFANNWGFYTLLTCLPQYLKHILKFDLKSNGFVSGLPYLVLWVIMIATGILSDWVRKRKFLSLTNIRKLFTAIGFIGPAVCMVATGYVNCDAAAAVALIVMSVGLSGISWGGWGVNHLDLAPAYAGTLMGITNAIATIPGFVGPSIVGALTYKNQTREAWRGVFYIAAGIYVFGTIFYVIFGSGERQKWATDDKSTPLDDHNVEVALLDNPKSGVKEVGVEMVKYTNGSKHDISDISPKAANHDVNSS